MLKSLPLEPPPPTIIPDVQISDVPLERTPSTEESLPATRAPPVPTQKNTASPRASSPALATTSPQSVPAPRSRALLVYTAATRAQLPAPCALPAICARVAHSPILKSALRAASPSAATSYSAPTAPRAISTTSRVLPAAARAVLDSLTHNLATPTAKIAQTKLHSLTQAPRLAPVRRAYMNPRRLATNRTHPVVVPTSLPYPTGAVSKRAIRPPRCLKAGQKACALYSAAIGRSRSVLKGFECVSVDSDLWSCGGCVDRSTLTGQHKDAGRDCSAIPDVDAVECQSGSCIVLNSQDADVVFQSSDGIQFRIHRLNLSVSSEGFSPPDQATFDDVTLLSETSSTLDLLFRFMYPEPQPDLERLEFEALALLAEAAEKYQVYSAINTSTINLIKRLPNHATEVLLHALKHGKCALLARVAPLLLDCRLEDILPLLPDHHIIPWVKYHAQWSNVWKRLISPDEVRQLPRTACAGCGRMPNDRVVEAMDNLSTTISVLQDLQSVFPKCSGCSELPAFSTWKQALEERIQKLPSTTEIFLARKLAPFQVSRFLIFLHHPLFTLQAGTEFYNRNTLGGDIRPAVVMWHAVRTKNGALMDEVAPFLIGHSLFETIKIFEHAMVSAWIDYYERWKTIARNALQFASQRQVSKKSLK
ncbi:hypothetical protein H0H81_000225, partial [Sphagnurus paluster]